jgi:hypothetical protein
MSFGNIAAARSVQSQSSSKLRSKKIPIYQHEVWSMIPDETIILRFVGGESEPHIFHQHGFARHPHRGFEKGICAKPEACELCVASSMPGEKRVKRASPYSAFTVYSTRKMLLTPVQRDDGSTVHRREPLRVDQAGTFITKCKNTGLTITCDDNRMNELQLEDEGLRVWCGSLHPKAANADQLLALDMQLQKVCQCGQRVGTGLGARPAEVHVEGDEATCTANCGNPRRGSLTSCYVQVTRRGQGTDTTYQFTPLPFSDPSPEHELNPLPLPEIYKPDTDVNREMLDARGIRLSGTEGAPAENIWT